MKGKRRYIVWLAIILVAVAAVFAVRQHRRYCNSGKSEVPPIPYTQMRDGDLAFRNGRGIYSELLLMTKKQCPDTLYYSHIGLVVNDPAEDGDHWVIVHAVPDEPDFKGDFDRVKVSTPEEFFSMERAYHGELVHTGVDFPRDLVYEALGFARDSVRFDNDYDLEDGTKLYCTELIHRLYSALGVDLTEGRRSNDFMSVFHHPVIQPVDIWLYKEKERYFIY